MHIILKDSNDGPIVINEDGVDKLQGDLLS